MTDNNHLCVICQTDIDKQKPDENLFIDCLHCFHKECWELYKTHNVSKGELSCPICKTVQERHESIDVVVLTNNNVSMNLHQVISINSQTETRCCLDKKSIKTLSIILTIVVMVIVMSFIWQYIK